jgi:hypothetical protein
MWHVKERRKMYTVFVRTPGWQVPFGGIRRSCEKDTSTDVKELGRERVVWIYLIKNVEKLWVLVTTVTNFGVPQNADIFLNS